MFAHLPPPAHAQVSNNVVVTCATQKLSFTSTTTKFYVSQSDPTVDQLIGGLPNVFAEALLPIFKKSFPGEVVLERAVRPSFTDPTVLTFKLAAVAHNYFIREPHLDKIHPLLLRGFHVSLLSFDETHRGLMNDAMLEVFFAGPLYTDEEGRVDLDIFKTHQPAKMSGFVNTAIIFVITTTTHQPTQISFNTLCSLSAANSDLPVNSFTHFISTHSNAFDGDSNQELMMLMPKGSYFAHDYEVSHRVLQLCGSLEHSSAKPNTFLMHSHPSENQEDHENHCVSNMESSIFLVTNSTLSLQSLTIELTNEIPNRNHGSVNFRPPRLAIVSDSMLMISESVLELSSWTSPILVSTSAFGESAAQSSVVVNKCTFSTENGQMRGLVETSAFPDISTSPTVSIVGCWFDSLAILGNDGICISLTPISRKSGEIVGTISPSLIGCSFVNVSSIGSSRQPQLSHLSQKMLGCVVSLTSSHLSGSTIRDVNNGGSLMCSNSTFSSFLSSPDTNTEPSITLPDGSHPTFAADQSYYYDNETFDESTSASFSFCHFVRDGSPTATRALWFSSYPGSITITSCSFSGIALTGSEGGAVLVAHVTGQTAQPVTITSTNFTDCSCLSISGGGLSATIVSPITVSHCRCVGCEAKGSQGQQNGGGMFLSSTHPSLESTYSDLYFDDCHTTYSGSGLFLSVSSPDTLISSIHVQRCSSGIGVNEQGHGGGMTLTIAKPIDVFASHIHVEDCCSESMGGGLFLSSPFGSTSLSDCQFVRCRLNGTTGAMGMGGGVRVTAYSKKCSFSNCEFDDCESSTLGGAIFLVGMSFDVIGCVVRNCLTDSFGAVCSMPISSASSLMISNTLFVGNTVGTTPSLFASDPSLENTTQFVDIAIYDGSNAQMTSITATDCYTTTAPNSAGYYLITVDPETSNIVFNEVTATLDVATNKIKVMVTGKIPVPSQEYDLTIREEGSGEKTTQRVQFTNGKCVLTSLSTTKTTNSIPTEAWSFNIAGNPTFATFTTPPQPPTLLKATAHLVTAEPQHALGS
ncbi:hypothetical protein BLNAU_4376 [Blattamonas nauphoetae]|uniref:Right handed beta helix domain-containing protein n=1 Tax=Blattamonas nauphoetae TaxID=2049346 RepID=A0ABQ9YAF4_9EUKA|nr:hypothetical protein BLNAU_4376 [Blattamonas nauphoetae]